MESIGRGRSPNALKLFQINLQLKKKVGVTFNEDPWSGEILLQVMIDLVRTGTLGVLDLIWRYHDPNVPQSVQNLWSNTPGVPPNHP